MRAVVGGEGGGRGGGCGRRRGPWTQARTRSRARSQAQARSRAGMRGVREAAASGARLRRIMAADSARRAPVRAGAILHVAWRAWAPAGCTSTASPRARARPRRAPSPRTTRRGGVHLRAGSACGCRRSSTCASRPSWSTSPRGWASLAQRGGGSSAPAWGSPWRRAGWRSGSADLRARPAGSGVPPGRRMAPAARARGMGGSGARAAGARCTTTRRGARRGSTSGSSKRSRRWTRVDDGWPDVRVPTLHRARRPRRRPWRSTCSWSSSPRAAGTCASSRSTTATSSPRRSERIAGRRRRPTRLLAGLLRAGLTPRRSHPHAPLAGALPLQHAPLRRCKTTATVIQSARPATGHPSESSSRTSP